MDRPSLQPLGEGEPQEAFLDVALEDPVFRRCFEVERRSLQSQLWSRRLRACVSVYEGQPGLRGDVSAFSGFVESVGAPVGGEELRARIEALLDPSKDSPVSS